MYVFNVWKSFFEAYSLSHIYGYKCMYAYLIFIFTYHARLSNNTLQEVLNWFVLGNTE